MSQVERVLSLNENNCNSCKSVIFFIFSIFKDTLKAIVDTTYVLRWLRCIRLEKNGAAIYDLPLPCELGKMADFTGFLKKLHEFCMKLFIYKKKCLRPFPKPTSVVSDQV